MNTRVITIRDFEMIKDLINEKEKGIISETDDEFLRNLYEHYKESSNPCVRTIYFLSKYSKFIDEE